MPIFTKKKVLKAMDGKREDLSYMFDNLSTELLETEKRLENIAYQINFFGATPELNSEKNDCELMLSWVQSQFDEIKKSLFQINAHSLSH